MFRQDALTHEKRAISNMGGAYEQYRWTRNLVLKITILFIYLVNSPVLFLEGVLTSKRTLIQYIHLIVVFPRLCFCFSIVFSVVRWLALLPHSEKVPEGWISVCLCLHVLPLSVLVFSRRPTGHIFEGVRHFSRPISAGIGSRSPCDPQKLKQYRWWMDWLDFVTFQRQGLGRISSPLIHPQTTQFTSSGGKHNNR